MVMLFGPGCPNIAPSAKRTVSEHPSGVPFDVALVRPTVTPALRPAALRVEENAISCRLSLALSAVSSFVRV
jgi:hypothetical protein